MPHCRTTQKQQTINDKNELIATIKIKTLAKIIANFCLNLTRKNKIPINTKLIATIKGIP